MTPSGQIYQSPALTKLRGVMGSRYKAHWSVGGQGTRQTGMFGDKAEKSIGGQGRLECWRTIYKADRSVDGQCRLKCWGTRYKTDWCDGGQYTRQTGIIST